MISATCPTEEGTNLKRCIAVLFLSRVVRSQHLKRELLVVFRLLYLGFNATPNKLVISIIDAFS